jgi:hypothetical protein
MLLPFRDIDCPAGNTQPSRNYKSNIFSAGFQPSKKLGGNLPWTFLYDNRYKWHLHLREMVLSSTIQSISDNMLSEKPDKGLGQEIKPNDVKLQV